MQIRLMAAGDLNAVAELAGELGYQTTPGQLEGRLTTLVPPTDAAFVAVEGEVVRGWVHVHVSRTLTAEPRAEILALVVSEQTRRKGVGQALVARAEGWAGERGLRAVRVRCSVARVDAHQFYRALGYRASKRQEVFDKTL